MKQKMEYFKEKFVKSKLYALSRLHPRRAEFVLVSLFFGALAALFMGPILFHFGSAVHGFWGDGTGGLIWLNTLDLGPLGGQSNAVIYPYGDDLFRPEFITAILFVLPFWLITKVAGAVVAWNAIIFISFWLCGVSMYYLAKKVSKSPMAALWAGTAFAYLPMHQYKAFGHIAYVMTFVFVFVLWRVLNFAERPTKRNALWLGVAFSVPFYIDGYYVLFTLILAGVPLLLLVGLQFWRLSKKTAEAFKAFLKSIAVFLATTFVLLLPIIAFKIMYGAKIASTLAMARGDFMSNVTVYTARWYDFVVPIETHPVFGAWATAFRTSHNHGSNTSEQTLYIGFVLLGLVGWTLYFFWKRRAKKHIKESPARRQTLVILLLVALVAFAIALPPFFHLLGHRIPMPSGVLSALVQYWRVYARLILIIHLVLVVVGAVGLALLLQRTRSKAMAWLVTAILIVVTLFEYLSFNPFHRQDIWYYDKLSSANTWLDKRKDIKVIAVYPLVDQPNGLASLYTTEQQVNNKKMINSGTVSQKAARLRASIAGLNDVQTLAVLKALGVQAIMTHEMPTDHTVRGIKALYSANEAPAGYAADVEVFKIDDAIAAAQYVLIADEGFTDVPSADLRTEHYFSAKGATLKLTALPGADTRPAQRTATFTLKTKANYKGNEIVVSQGTKVLDVLRPGASDTMIQSYDVIPEEPIRLTVVGTLEQDSVYIKGMFGR